MSVAAAFDDRGERRWKTFVLWELLRVPYNVIMFVGGVASLEIAHVTIPLLYTLIGIALNVFYTFLWIADLAILRERGRSRVGLLFFGYVACSLAIVFSIAFIFLLRLWRG